MREASQRLAADPEWADDLIEPPEMLGVEQITIDGAMLRTTVKTSAEAQWRVGRELRRRLTEALATAGINSQVPVGRLSIQPAIAGAEETHEETGGNATGGNATGGNATGGTATGEE
jgi:small conductance mechanosensitive channel